MVKSYVVGGWVGGGGGLQDYTVSSLGQVILLLSSRPRSLTISNKIGGGFYLGTHIHWTNDLSWTEKKTSFWFVGHVTPHVRYNPSYQSQSLMLVTRHKTFSLHINISPLDDWRRLEVNTCFFLLFLIHFSWRSQTLQLVFAWRAPDPVAWLYLRILLMMIMKIYDYWGNAR